MPAPCAIFELGIYDTKSSSRYGCCLWPALSNEVRAFVDAELARLNFPRRRQRAPFAFGRIVFSTHVILGALTSPTFAPHAAAKAAAFSIPRARTMETWAAKAFAEYLVLPGSKLSGVPRHGFFE